MSEGGWDTLGISTAAAHAHIYTVVRDEAAANFKQALKCSARGQFAQSALTQRDRECKWNKRRPPPPPRNVHTQR